MRINNNMMAMNTHRQLGIATEAGAKSMEKLSSGYRINRAGDDAAGLAISEKMRGQIRGLNQASSNAQDGISLIQTAEGALNETHSILQRMRELAVQSASDTNTSSVDAVDADDATDTPEIPAVVGDREEIQKEIDQLAKEITRIAKDTEFNTMNLLDGGFSGKKFHIGANATQNVELTIADMSAGTDGLNVSSITDGEEVGVDVTTQSAADSAITTINNAITTVSSERSKLGAMQNRLDHTIKNLDTSAENLQSSEARIRDVDMAKELMEQTKQNILQQASQAMLAQANQQPQGVLQLLR